MKNLEEKLSLMKWFHQQGLEPEMWYADSVITDKPFESEERVISYSDWVPFFPLEQVLELMEADRFADFIMNDYVNGQANIIPDYHLAALKLLKQVMEQYSEEVKR